MSVNDDKNNKNDKENETPIEHEFNDLNIIDLVTINQENCYQPNNGVRNVLLLV
jgi:hypothetical protein